MENLSDDQEIWRFLNRQKLSDLVHSGELRLSRISELRKLDERESRLPSVVRDVLRRIPLNANGRACVDQLLEACEDQALDVFASCWFLPRTREEELRMWEEFGGGKEGGIRINSTLGRLLSSLPTDDRRSFSIGRIHYIADDISYLEVLALGQYRSMPFLLKLKNHTNEEKFAYSSGFTCLKRTGTLNQNSPLVPDSESRTRI